MASSPSLTDTETGERKEKSGWVNTLLGGAFVLSVAPARSGSGLCLGADRLPGPPIRFCCSPTALPSAHKAQGLLRRSWR